MRLAVAVVVLLLAAGGAGADDRALRFGVQAGLSLASLSADPDPAPFALDTAARGSASAHLEYCLSDHVFLETRAAYVQKGARGTVAAAPGVELHFLLDYVALPLFLKVKYGERLRPYLMAGPEIGFKTDATVRLRVEDESEQTDVGDDITSTDIGAVLGAGFEFPAGGLTAFVEGLYSLGLRDVSVDDETEIKTRTVVVSAGLRF